MVKSKQKIIGSIFIIWFIFESIFNLCLAGLTMDRLRQRYNLAVSDYLEAIASCNGALRDSAIRQFNRIRDELDAIKDRAKDDYETMTKNLIKIYQQLAEYFDEPSNAKAFLDIAMGYVPVIGNAYGAANTIYSLADEHVRSAEGKAIFNQAKKQIKEMDKASQEYNRYRDFERELAERLDRLGKQFRDNCRGKELGTWRYDTDAATVYQSGIADISYSGQDRTTGEVFKGRAKNNTGEDVIIDFPPGTTIIPDDPRYQRMIITEGGRILIPPRGITEFPLGGGFCLDPRGYPPPSETPRGGLKYFPGPPTVFIPDGNPFNQDFPFIPFLPELVRQLQKEGKLPKTGLPPDMEYITIIQWFIWELMENFNPDDGKAKIEEQVKETGGTQTPEQIDELNKNIWAGIDLVKKEVHKAVK